MPSAEPSPRPWRVSDGFLDRYSTGHGDIVDAKGELVAVRVPAADAALIVAAVNKLDRFRDQLAAALRLADECSRDAAAVHAGRARAVEDAQSEANRRADRLADIVRRMLPLARERLATIDAADCELIREARAAIGGEGKE